MPNYKFPNWNTEINNPTVEFNQLNSWDVETKKGSIQCVLTTPNGSKFSVALDNIDLPTVNAGTIDSKGAIELAKYEI